MWRFFKSLDYKVQNDKVVDVKFKCKGCMAAIATSSIMTTMTKGLSVKKAVSQITDTAIVKAIDRLSEEKFHCSNLGVSVL